MPTRDEASLIVVGAGSWAVAAHLPSLATRAQDVKFIGVCRQGQGPLTRIQERFGFAVASEDYRDVLAAHPDIVVVASPPHLHHEHAMAARAGAHVLCEKPFTLTSADAWEIVREADRRHRNLLLSFGWNYLPMVRHARRLLAERSIGRLEHLSIVMSSQTRELLTGTGAYPDASPETVPESATWTDPAASGGGYGAGTALPRARPRLRAHRRQGHRCVRVAGAAARSPVELHDAICLRLDGGGVAGVSGGSSCVGADANKHQPSVEAIGSRGQWHIDVLRERFSLFCPGEAQIDLHVRPATAPTTDLSPHNAWSTSRSAARLTIRPRESWARAPSRRWSSSTAVPGPGVLRAGEG